VSRRPDGHLVRRPQPFRSSSASPARSRCRDCCFTPIAAAQRRHRGWPLERRCSGLAGRAETPAFRLVVAAMRIVAGGPADPEFRALQVGLRQRRDARSARNAGAARVGGGASATPHEPQGGPAISGLVLGFAIRKKGRLHRPAAAPAEDVDVTSKPPDAREIRDGLPERVAGRIVALRGRVAPRTPSCCVGPSTNQRTRGSGTPRRGLSFWTRADRRRCWRRRPVTAGLFDRFAG
jgi:hypothetical protein